MLDFEKIKANIEAVHNDEILPPMSITTEIPAEKRDFLKKSAFLCNLFVFCALSGQKQQYNKRR